MKPARFKTDNHFLCTIFSLLLPVLFISAPVLISYIVFPAAKPDFPGLLVYLSGISAVENSVFYYLKFAPLLSLIILPLPLLLGSTIKKKTAVTILTGLSAILIIPHAPLLHFTCGFLAALLRRPPENGLYSVSAILIMVWHSSAMSAASAGLMFSQTGSFCKTGNPLEKRRLPLPERAYRRLISAVPGIAPAVLSVLIVFAVYLSDASIDRIIYVNEGIRIFSAAGTLFSLLKYNDGGIFFAAVISVGAAYSAVYSAAYLLLKSILKQIRDFVPAEKKMLVSIENLSYRLYRRVLSFFTIMLFLLPLTVTCFGFVFKIISGGLTAGNDLLPPLSVLAARELRLIIIPLILFTAPPLLSRFISIRIANENLLRALFLFIILCQPVVSIFFYIIAQKTLITAIQEPFYHAYIVIPFIIVNTLFFRRIIEKYPSPGDEAGKIQIYLYIHRPVLAPIVTGLTLLLISFVLSGNGWQFYKGTGNPDTAVRILFFLIESTAPSSILRETALFMMIIIPVLFNITGIRLIRTSLEDN